ncbi:MAG: DUF502 domain-containing protein [Verrucomicrobia bacterium]|nr:DUF502 domain-containing protein [Verrucomicrobiota bacterium]
MISRIFWRGIKTLLPFAVTIAILYWVCDAVEHLFAAILKWFMPPQYYFTGLGFLVGITLVFAVGIAINAWIAGWAKDKFDNILNRIPLVKTLYRSATDLMNFFDRPKTEGSRVVSFESSGGRMLGIVTREQFEGCPAGIGEKEEVILYLPLAYQIGGVMLIVPKKDLKPIDMSVEYAMRFIMTCGMQGGVK